MDLNIERIEQAIVEQALDRLFEEGNVLSVLHKRLEERVNTLWSTHGEAQIMATIDQAVKAGFEHEYTKVSSFGRPQGEPTTLAKELERQVETYWQTKVDNNGQPSTGYGAKLTRAEWVMARMVSDSYAQQIQSMVSSCAGMFKDQLRKSLFASTNDMLSHMFKVQTPTDQAISATRDPEAEGKPVPVPEVTVQQVLQAHAPTRPV